MDSDFRPPKKAAKLVQAKDKTNNLAETAKPTPKTFQTPEEVAALDDLQQPASLLNPDLAALPGSVPVHNLLAESKSTRTDPVRAGLKRWLAWPPGEKAWLGSLVVILIIGAIIGLIITHVGHKPVIQAEQVKPPKSAKPVALVSNLTGLPIANASINQRPVTGVMIENTLDARPQSGLSQAGVVFEAVAEGGITRFLALYQDNAPSNIGPVRSARPYYVQWAMGFDAAYAHAGGSPDALSDITSWQTRNLDYLQNPSAYHRVSNRQAPHNLYTSMAALNQLETSKGYTTSQYTSFPRKTASPSKQPTAGTISLTMSGPLYNDQYTYNAATNSYNRSEGGAPQIDANTNTQLSPTVVIAMVIPETNGTLDSSGAYYSDYASIGSGSVYVFQDGGVSTGTWTKASNSAQISFHNATGQPIKLDPGQTWLTAVDSASAVHYTP